MQKRGTRVPCKIALTLLRPPAFFNATREHLAPDQHSLASSTRFLGRAPSPPRLLPLALLVAPLQLGSAALSQLHISISANISKSCYEPHRPKFARSLSSQVRLALLHHPSLRLPNQLRIRFSHAANGRSLHSSLPAVSSPDHLPRRPLLSLLPPTPPSVRIRFGLKRTRHQTPLCTTAGGLPIPPPSRSSNLVSHLVHLAALVDPQPCPNLRHTSIPSFLSSPLRIQSHPVLS